MRRWRCWSRRRSRTLRRAWTSSLAVLTAALAGLLWSRRSLFVVTFPPARVSTVVTLAASMLCLTILYAVSGLLLHAAEVTPALTPGRVVDEIASRVVGLPGPLQIGGRFGHWFPPSLTVLGAVMVVTTLLVALAPNPLRGAPSEADREQVRRLLDRTDGDTLDPFIVRRDKRLIFCPNRHAVLGYRRVHGVCVATGDPVGDPAAFGDTVRTFLEACTRHGWHPALLGARTDHLWIYQQLGLRTLYLGDEAVIDVGDFSLRGRRMRNTRQAVHHADRAGATTQIIPERQLDADLRRTLLHIADVQHRDYREFGFSMALSDPLTGVLPNCILTICRDHTGAPVGFQRYAPCKAGRALSLDTMRRLPHAPSGVNEHMIVRTIEWARSHAVEQVSLNFAAFRTLLDPATPLDRTTSMEAFVVQHLEGHLGIQIDSLRRFNAKFSPRWVPRHLVYRPGATSRPSPSPRSAPKATYRSTPADPKMGVGPRLRHPDPGQENNSPQNVGRRYGRRHRRGSPTPSTLAHPRHRGRGPRL